MAEVQDNGGLYADGGYEHASDHFLYAMYLFEQASNNGN